jgi:Fic family protein
MFRVDSALVEPLLQEFSNCVERYRYLAARQCRYRPPVGERTIRLLHQSLLQPGPGKPPNRYRRQDVWLLHHRRKIVSSTPAWESVPLLMKRLGRWFRGRARHQPVIVRAALAHLELVAIHPFDDANGRTARAFSKLLLVRADVVPETLCLERLFAESDRARYSSAIEKSLGRHYQRNYDSTPFVCYFISTVTAALRREIRLFKRGGSSGRVQMDAGNATHFR